MPSTIQWGYRKVELTVGNFLKHQVSFGEPVVYEVAKIVKVNPASVKLDNGETVMADSARARGSQNYYTIVTADEDVDAMREAHKAWVAERMEAKRKAAEEKRARANQAQLAEEAKRAEVAMLNDTALRNFQTTLLPDGTAMHITTLTNRYNETAVYMFTVRQEENRWSHREDAPKFVTRVDYVSYEARHGDGKEFNRRGSETGETLYEALLNIIV